MIKNSQARPQPTRIAKGLIILVITARNLSMKLSTDRAVTTTTRLESGTQLSVTCILSDYGFADNNVMVIIIIIAFIICFFRKQQHSGAPNFTAVGSSMSLVYWKG